MDWKVEGLERVVGVGTRTAQLQPMRREAGESLLRAVWQRKCRDLKGK